MAAVQPGQDVFETDDTEVARLKYLHTFLNEVLGGIPGLAPSPTILILGCGPGAWAFEVAAAYPQHAVIGVDSRASLLEAARTEALVQGIANVRFLLYPDMAAPLSLLDGSIDYVYARLLAPLLGRATWPRVLGECLRLLRPGGVIRLTEAELPLTSSPSFD